MDTKTSMVSNPAAAYDPAEDQTRIVDEFLESLGEDVKRIDTHASIILLTKERAYKIKRAVAYDFLDYSTLERRRRACVREFEINRRSAPGLYIGVTPISEHPTDPSKGLHLDGTGNVLEWALVMHRFPDGSLFSEMAALGTLAGHQVTEATQRIASLHQTAPDIDQNQLHGGGSIAFAKMLSETLTDLKNNCARLDNLRLSGIATAVAAHMASVAEVLDRRLANGFVRACHGDLHLGNICMFEGAPTPFDAVEFNPAISNIDTLYDISFLWMDLVHQGLPDLANLSFNTYLQACGGYEDLSVVPLFLAARALIRCRVELARQALSEDAPPTGQRNETANSYLRLAQYFLGGHEADLVAVGGLSGTGKTTVARSLAPRLGIAPGAVHLRSDMIRKRLFGVNPLEHLPAFAYEPQHTKSVYHTMLDEAAAVLEAGWPVVLDAVFSDADERAAVEHLALTHEVPLTAVWLEAPMRTRLARVAGRVGDASDADETVVKRQDAMQSQPPENWLSLDASQSVARLTDQIHHARIKSPE